MSVIDTDTFLDMPLSSQALYFHLGMHGDDDGFVGSAKRISRSIGCNDDDIRILAAKGFIIPFESGVVVIRDWKINNTLKNDRYHETIYLQEKSMLAVDDANRYQLGTSMEPSRNQLGTSMEPEHNITKHNVTEHSITKDSKENTCSDFDVFWAAYPRKQNKATARKAFAKVEVPLETLLQAIEAHKQTEQWRRDGGKFIPYPASWLNAGAWEDELDMVDEKYNQGQWSEDDFFLGGGK